MTSTLSLVTNASYELNAISALKVLANSFARRSSVEATAIRGASLTSLRSDANFLAIFPQPKMPHLIFCITINIYFAPDSHPPHGPEGMKSGTYFHFKQFSVRHDRCAMKVGTDAVLLGAWVDVSGVKNVLDIGTGSGVITLMLAQRTTNSVKIESVEIEKSAADQAAENFRDST